MSNNEFATLDARIAALLRDRNGRPLGNSEIAKHFGLLSTQSITVVKRLERAGVVCADKSRSQTKYYIPTEAQKAEQQATLDAAISALSDVRPFRPYVVPQPMRDIMARIKAERDAIPSHYGEAA